MRQSRLRVCVRAERLHTARLQVFVPPPAWLARRGRKDGFKTET